MKITAITRYKHGKLYEIIKRLCWTQRELSRQTGIANGTIGNIINLVSRPTAEQADAIQKALGSAGEYLDVLAEWSETFAGLKRGYRREQTADVKMENILGCHEALEIPAPDFNDTNELDSAIQTALTLQKPIEQKVIKDIFWGEMTYKQCGNKHGLSLERIRQIEATALRSMRRHKTMRIIAPHVDRTIETT